MRVQVKPMPERYRRVPAKYRPIHPPIFPYGNPTEQEIELARELFRLLDDESKEWYGRRGIFAGL